MEDRYADLLQKVLDENTRLRETIEARDNEQKRILQELSSKFESNGTSTPPRTTGRKRKRTIAVSPQCRQDFRKMYKVLKENETFTPGFILDERFTSEANQNVTKTVIEAVVADYCGVDKCPWSTAVLKSAAATYFKSLHDSSTRAKSGKLERHGTLCRRQGRMRDKIQRRLSSLKAMPWSVEKKKVIEQAVGSMDYTSSDESDWSEDENGESRLSAFLVKKLPWERTCLKNVKKTLDEAYMGRLNKRARQNLATRRDHRLPSTRDPPTERLQWAVRDLPTTGPSTPSTIPTPAMASSESSSGTSPSTPSTGTRPRTHSTGTRPTTPRPTTGTTPSIPRPSTGTSSQTHSSSTPLSSRNVTLSKSTKQGKSKKNTRTKSPEY